MPKGSVCKQRRQASRAVKERVAGFEGCKEEGEKEKEKEKEKKTKKREAIIEGRRRGGEEGQGSGIYKGGCDGWTGVGGWMGGGGGRGRIRILTHGTCVLAADSIRSPVPTTNDMARCAP